MKQRDLLTNYIQQFMEAQKQGQDMILIKARQTGSNFALHLSMMQAQVEKEAKMIIEDFKMLLMETYLEGGFDAKQHARLEQLLNSSEVDNQKLAVKLIEQESGKTIEIQKCLDNSTRKTVVVKTSSSN